LVKVENDLGRVRLLLGGEHQRLARGAKPEDRDVAGDQRIRVAVPAELGAHAAERLLPRPRRPFEDGPSLRRGRAARAVGPMPCAIPCGWSQMKASEITARMPTAVAARAAISGVSTVPASRKQVVPLRIISMPARRQARYSSSSLTVLKKTLSKVLKASVSRS